MPTLSGPPKSFARMGSAESEVGSTAAELQVIPPFLPTILGSSESFARMGSAESEVGSTAAELQVIPTFLMNAPCPLITWSGNQPCDPSAERDVYW